MEFVTIHELARMSGVSTATIRLDIKAGKIPIAAPGKRGRGNPTRIRIADLKESERIQYQQLAKRFLQGGTLSGNERGTGKYTVNELALKTGLSPQVVRKDILDGKLKAEGGGKRGSPYYIFAEDLLHALRIEYRRLFDSRQTEQESSLEKLQSEMLQLKHEVQEIKERLRFLDGKSTIAHNEALAGDDQSGSQNYPNSDSPVFEHIPVASIVLPSVFEGYYVSEEKLKQIKAQLHKGELMEPVLLRKTDDNVYLLRKGIAQYHVALEKGLSVIPAYLEISEE
jgi:hypothetical protein